MLSRSLCKVSSSDLDTNVGNFKAIHLSSRSRTLISTNTLSEIVVVQRCGISGSSCLTMAFKLPPTYDHVVYPERRRLKIIDKVPFIEPGVRPPKMMKDLYQMRGPELVQNKLLYGDYGLQAVTGGRITHKDTEAVRQIILKQMDERYMFAVWRFSQLWQSVTRKGLGRRMGGGKGSIDHYVFPFRAERVLLEMGGHCEFVEVYSVLKAIQKKLSFRSRIITHESVRQREEKEKWEEENNQNPFTFKYCVEKNIMGCSKYLNRYDYMWFGKYL